ncbi:codanin-1 [Gadus macrocephalus]|uniref:codanin-1 n=1 Tax=Gadus macrocephalus TaxID=80720 RepID=UPI0028CB4166|nr:codanin-1 [Gadus macrocephalus]
MTIATARAVERPGDAPPLPPPPQSAPVLDVCGLLRRCVGRGRAVLTLPWMVEFLSMLDFTGPLLPCYRSALGSLLLLYRGLVLGRGGEVCYLNKLLMVAALGWLFQIPVIPEDIFFTSDFTDVARLEDPPPGVQGLDCLPLVDQQLLYVCCPFLGEFRKILAAFVSGSAAKSSGILRKITPTSAEPRDAPIANRSQQKLQVDLEQAFFHNQPPSLRRTVEFVAERVGSNCVKHMKATLVSELVQRGEELLRAGLQSPGASGPKLHEAIGAQLSDRGMEAPARATRFCSDKSPDAIRNLLPVETSPVVLTTSENITKRLATEKACSWLAANITALIRREWKSRFDRVMKSMDAQGAGLEPANQALPSTPKRKPGGERALVCPTACPHAAPLPSDVLIQMKEVLSVGVGPRTEAELLTGPELRALLGRVGEALACRKFLTPVSEQMLLRSTVLLACQIVGGDLPVLSPQGVGDGDPGSSPGAGPGEGGGVLEALADLWERECCWATPLHLLFSELNVTAVLRAPPKGLDSYEFLVRRLLTKGLLGEEELASHWRKLSGVSPIQVLTEKFELLPFLLVKPAMALPETLSPTGQ